MRTSEEKVVGQTSKAKRAELTFVIDASQANVIRMKCSTFEAEMDRMHSLRLSAAFSNMWVISRKPAASR